MVDNIDIQYSLQDYDTIRMSLYFDLGWYVSNYAQIETIDPIAHYLVYGYKELNDPSPFFKTSEYYDLYPDVKNANVNPLLHFENFGKNEVRFFNRKMRDDYNLIKESHEFDELYYVNTYFETQYFADPVWHFLIEGCNNDHNPNQNFDVKKYCRQNETILNDENPFVHYLNNWGKEQIFKSKQHFNEYLAVQKSSLFDERFYISQCTDFETTKMDPCYHYINFGYKEDKKPSAKFDDNKYRIMNSDIDYSSISPLGHYLLYGIKEGRFKSKHEQMYSSISNSRYFDHQFYINNLKTDKVDPVDHYINFGCKEGRPTSKLFSTKVYYILNPDVYYESVNALYHYESTGKAEGRKISIEIDPKKSFAEEAIESQGDGYYDNIHLKRLAIVASYSSDSRLPKSTEYMVNALKEVCGKIIFVMDNPILPDEAERIKHICSYYICKRHEEYDFGSYKYGYLASKTLYDLTDFDEIVMCNDSVYGPINGFKTVFSSMQCRSVDFWGLSIAKNNFGESIQSFFYVFLPSVFLSKIFDRYFSSISKESSREQIVIKYEFQLSLKFSNEGYKYDSFIDSAFYMQCKIPTKLALTLISKYNFPLIKKKALTGTCLESKRSIIDYIKKENTQLYDIMCKDGVLNYIEEEETAISDNDYITIKNSKYFDSNYYLNEYFSLDGVDPIDHYTRYGFLERKNPSSLFSTDEYYELYPDVKRAAMNPLLHYEKYGKLQNRHIFIDFVEQKFNKKAINYEKQFLKLQPGDTKIAAIFSAYSSECKISPRIIYYLKELSKCVDYIVFIADNPIFKSEISKLSDLVGYAKFERHNEYDFGSYKRGFLLLKQQPAFDCIEEIVFCNDSCAGPLFGFAGVFEEMKNTICDAWSMTISNYTGIEHIQSYFFVLKRKIFTSKVFESFINSVKGELSSYCVIEKYESGLAKLITSLGLNYASFIPACTDPSLNPIMHPLEQAQYALPLIKMKALSGYYNKANPQTILSFLQRTNSELASIIIQEQNIMSSSKLLNEACEATLPVSAVKSFSLPVTVHFYVENCSMFSARSLFETMLKDARFQPYLIVIPDLRFGNDHAIRQRNSVYQELCASYGQNLVINSFDETTKQYIDMTKESQLVCLSSQYNLSHCYYTLRYVAKRCRTIYIPYGLYRAKYDRYLYASENFSLFWKVFLETQYNYVEASKYSKCKATNCVVTGYAKMDSFFAFDKIETASRKTIILAPHHSMNGGYNRIMNLSTFMSYHKLFLMLPRRYQNVDFIFRPHPMLFDCLKQDKFWGENKVADYINTISAYSNVEISDKGNYFDIFAKSDAIIHDCGSFLVEYFYTKKPQCFLLKNDKQITEIFATLGRLCLNRCYKAFSENEIYCFIENTVLKEIDPLQQERERFSQEEIMINYPNASKIIIEDIMSST